MSAKINDNKKFQTTRKTTVVAYDSLLKDLVIENTNENFLLYFSLTDIQTALNKVYNLKDRNLMQYYDGYAGDTLPSIKVIRESRLIFEAYEDENGSIGIEGVITFPGDIKISKKTTANLKAFINVNGVAEIIVKSYYLQMGKSKTPSIWKFWQKGFR